MKCSNTLRFLLLILCILSLPFFSNLSNADDIQLVSVRKGDTVSYLSFKIYGMYNERINELLRKENPDIKDINLIYAGQELRFPTLAAMKVRLNDKQSSPQDITEPEKSAELSQMKAQANKAVITYLEGKVQVRKNGSATWSAASPNQILYVKDEIKVLKKSRAELILDNRSVMRLSENTELMLRQLDVEPVSKKETTSMGLSLGKLWTKASKVFNPASRLEVRTPTAIAGVQGTVYQVNVENERKTEIQVYDGAVAVYNPSPSSGPLSDRSGAVPGAPRTIQGPKPVAGPTAVSREAWTEIILRKAQQITVTDQGIPRPVSFNIDQERQNEWVRWNEARDTDFLPPERMR